MCKWAHIELQSSLHSYCRIVWYSEKKIMIDLSLVNWCDVENDAVFLIIGKTSERPLFVDRRQIMSKFDFLLILQNVIRTEWSCAAAIVFHCSYSECLTRRKSQKILFIWVSKNNQQWTNETHSILRLAFLLFVKSPKHSRLRMGRIQNPESNDWL